MDDIELLREFASHHSEEAFRTVVERHIDFVRNADQIPPRGETAELRNVRKLAHFVTVSLTTFQMPFIPKSSRSRTVATRYSE